VGDPVTKVILGENIAQVDAPSGRRYGGNTQGRVFDMSASDAAAVVKLGGALASVSGTTRRRLGWRCPACGFGSFLKTCSRCGGKCARE
jgi:hypothetical protein